MKKILYICLAALLCFSLPVYATQDPPSAPSEESGGLPEDTAPSAEDTSEPSDSESDSSESGSDDTSDTESDTSDTESETEDIVMPAEGELVLLCEPTVNGASFFVEVYIENGAGVRGGSGRFSFPKSVKHISTSLESPGGAKVKALVSGENVSFVFWGGETLTGLSKIASFEFAPLTGHTGTVFSFLLLEGFLTDGYTDTPSRLNFCIATLGYDITPPETTEEETTTKPEETTEEETTTAPEETTADTTSEPVTTEPVTTEPVTTEAEPTTETTFFEETESETESASVTEKPPEKPKGGTMKYVFITVGAVVLLLLIGAGVYLIAVKQRKN